MQIINALVFGIFGDRQGVAKPLVMSFYEASDQYGPGNIPFQFPAACSSVCVGASSPRSADVVLANIYKTKVNRPALGQQLWVATFWESPQHYHAISPPQEFDYIASYAPDSTVPIYNMVLDTFRQFNAATVVNDVPYAVRVHNNLLSVWISNCNARERLDLLQQLATEGITYTSYGSCHHTIHNQQAQYPTPWDGVEDNIYKLAAQHMFFYAAENSKCRGYVTEKVYHGLVAGSIPIYFGTNDAKHMVPTNSTIFASDYTARALVQHMRSIATDPAVYDRYMAWRQRPLEPHMRRMMRPSDTWKCELCEAVHNRVPRHTWKSYC